MNGSIWRIGRPQAGHVPMRRARHVREVRDFPAPVRALLDDCMSRTVAVTVSRDIGGTR
jgi:hypothetical protein